MILICLVILISTTSTTAYAESLTNELENGTIQRTPLLQHGQSIKTLPHGLYPVTGGSLQIGYVGNGGVTKIIGMCANGLPDSLEDFRYAAGKQPFNRNFASVLFEMRAAGQHHGSYTSMDYFTAGRETPFNNLNISYINGYRQSMGLPVASYGEFAISNALINGIAR